MAVQLKLGDIAVDVVLKDIKNVHLSVHPPTGRVRIAAPLHMGTHTIRLFAISKLGWIRQQQRRLQSQERETPREYLDRESHYLWGKRYLLAITEVDKVPAVETSHSRLLLRMRPGTDPVRRHALMEQWFRDQLKKAVPAVLAKWQPLMDVSVGRFFVQRMKTKWGSCNASTRSIRLNTELAKKPPQCLEYVVVHELAHLVERHHNERFVALMDAHLPSWRMHRQELNAAPLAHETWRY